MKNWKHTAVEMGQNRVVFIAKTNPDVQPGTKEKHLILDSDSKWESGPEPTSCVTVILFNC